MNTHDEQDQDLIASAPADEAATEPLAAPGTPEAEGSPHPGFPRRALLRAGWAIPAIMALDAVLPTAAEAVFGNSGGFANFPGGFGNTFNNTFRNTP